MKKLKTTAAFTLLLVTLMFLPGCIGQEEEPPATITQTATQTATITGTVTETKEPITTEPEVTNPYLWSGKLDGEGIPPDFFSDINVRKAFAYAFDYETFLQDAFKGEAINPVTPIVEGLLYRNPDQTGYALDLAKSEEHFKLAWDGQIWELGFKMTLLYNTGNVQRKVACEILKENIESLNERFFIYVRSIDWPSMLRDMIDGRLPMFSIGWGADYPDPHNFAFPFMHSDGTFSAWQLYNNPTVDALIEEGGVSTDPVRRKEIYYELQRLYIEDCPSFMTHQATVRRYERDWMQGWYYVPIGGEIPFYSLSKAPGAKNPDTYIFASISEQETMDPAWAYDNASGNVIAGIYETLIDYADPAKKVPETLDVSELTRTSAEFKPVLAEEVPTVENGGISPDGLTYTLKLKKGLTFQNGNPLTPEDVEYSFERLMVMDRDGGPAWMHFEPLLGNYGTRDGDGNIVVDFADIDAAVEVDGDNIVFNLAQPFPPFINILCMQYGSAIMDKEWCIANGCWDGTAESYPDYNNPEISPINDIAMGTGPYKLLRWEHEVEYWLERWDDYRMGPAPLKYINRLSIDEWSTRKLMFQNGDADSVYVPTQYIEELEDIEGIRVIKGFPDLGGVALFFTFEVQS